MRKIDRIATSGQARVRRAQICGGDAREVVRRFHADVQQPDMALVMFFCSGEFDLAAISEEMRQLFQGVQVVGCTTAGEIGPDGYQQHSLSGVSLPAAEFDVVVGGLKGLEHFEIARGYGLAQGLLQRLESAAPATGPERSFGLTLIDGMSMREEQICHALQEGLGGIPLVGGSAGDGLRFGSTYVYFDGTFHRDSAVLVLATTNLPFKVFKTQHFIATDTRLVVTKADAPKRLVQEVDGLPAAEAYAHLLGLDEDELDPMRFAAAPVVLMVDGTNYVRSIQKANPDGSLSLFCAIEEGLVLRLAKGVDLVANLEQTLADLTAELGPPQLMLTFDCILRRLEVTHNHVEDRVSRILAQSNATGFNTYGEQFHGVHVNQTLTGLAIGRRPAPLDHA